jgi:hypothetical protein
VHQLSPSPAAACWPLSYKGTAHAGLTISESDSFGLLLAACLCADAAAEPALGDGRDGRGDWLMVGQAGADEDADADAETDAHIVVVGLCTPQSITLLGILPFCNICGFLWIYTALPLHFLDSGWPLWQLSVLLTVVYIPRVVMTTITTRLGDWVCVPASVLAAALNFYMLLRPGSLTAVWVATTATCTSLNPPAYRSMVYAHFQSSGTTQLQRALRIFTLADTMGYATAPFIGGLLYDSGGLRACAAFAFATTGGGALLSLCLHVCRASFVECWQRRRRFGKRDSRPAEVMVDEATNTTEHDSTKAAIAVVMLAAATNICVCQWSHSTVSLCARLFTSVSSSASKLWLTCADGVEWCLYAIYFRLQYGWSGSWCGFAQMVGDLLAGGVLGVSTLPCITNRASSQARSTTHASTGERTVSVMCVFCFD